MASISLSSVPGTKSTENDVPRLETHLLATDTPLGAVIVVPGGGYYGRAWHEGDPVAEAYNKEGFHAFVLHYRVNPCSYPSQLADIVHAIRLIRKNAEEWKINPRQIAVCGFSAGGHLAGASGVFYSQIGRESPDDDIGRPDAMILSYAVLSSKHPHEGTFRAFSGDYHATPEKYARYSIPEAVSDSTPPAFIWHTADDDAVPSEGALAMAMALRERRITCEIHIFNHGCHGIGLADGDGDHTKRAKLWLPLSAGFLRELGFVSLPTK